MNHFDEMQEELENAGTSIAATERLGAMGETMIRYAGDIVNQKDALQWQLEAVKSVASRTERALERGQRLNELDEFQGAAQKADVLVSRIAEKRAALAALAAAQDGMVSTD